MPTSATTLPLSASESLVAARDALTRCTSLLDALASDPAVNGSGVLHVVVLDAAAPEHEDGVVLAERSYGLPPVRWDADYAAYARAKAALSWRLRRDSHAVQTLMPQCLRPGDTRLWGSVYLDGLVVAVSGCEAPYDEAAALAVAALMRAYLKLGKHP